MQRAEAQDQFRTIDACHFPIGEQARQTGQSYTVVWVVEGRD
jgi:hypothetical protein